MMTKDSPPILNTELNSMVSDLRDMIGSVQDKEEETLLKKVLFLIDRVRAELISVQVERDNEAFKSSLARKTLLLKKDCAEAQLARALEIIRPFAKAGELFNDENPNGIDQLIYGPAAGEEYSISADHLRSANRFLSQNL